MTRKVLSTLLGVAAVGTLVSAQQKTEPIAVTFSEPDRPGVVSVSSMDGSITVKGEDRTDVLVSAIGGNRRQPRVALEPPMPQGFRRLNQGAALTITQENNQISVKTARETDIELRVPKRVTLKLLGMNGERIAVEDVEGEIEATHKDGDIRLVNIAGSVVANTFNGDVLVTLAQVRNDKAMAFTSFNGKVDVTLPASASFNVKMGSDNGDVFTDFDVQMRPSPPQGRRQVDGKTFIYVNQSIFGAVNGGGQSIELKTFNGNIYLRKGT
jgi:hypothetical protein